MALQVQYLVLGPQLFGLHVSSKLKINFVAAAHVLLPISTTIVIASVSAAGWRCGCHETQHIG